MTTVKMKNELVNKVINSIDNMYDTRKEVGIMVTITLAAIPLIVSLVAFVAFLIAICYNELDQVWTVLFLLSVSVTVYFVVFGLLASFGML